MHGVLLLVAFLLASAAALAQDCQLVRMEEWRVRLERDLPVIDGEINRQKAGILLDTGAERSHVTRSAAVRLGLARFDVGGTAALEAVRIDELRIGPAMRKDWTALLAADLDFGTDVALVLGRDFFAALELELDFANRAVRLFQARGCPGVPLAYWAKGTPAGEARLEPGSDIAVTVSVNGRPLRAALDSGAAVSALGMVEAARLGFTPQASQVKPAGCAIGIARRPVDYWAAPMESFVIGNETIRNPTLRFAELPAKDADPFTGGAQMVLGMDFLRSHRVLVSSSQRRLYFTYVGGPVFPLGPIPGCQDPRQ